MRQLSKKDASRYFSDPTKELQKIRRHYYETRRTTTHWPAPIYAIEPKTTENTLMDLCEFKDKIQNII